MITINNLEVLEKYSEKKKEVQKRVDDFNKQYKQNDKTPYGVLRGTAYTYVGKAWIPIVGIAEDIELT